MQNEKLNYNYKLAADTPTAGAYVVKYVEDSSNVLEIGAGPGSITDHLIQEKNCDVTAIEIEERYLERLRQKCKSTHKLDLNDHRWIEAFGDQKFDSVIAADVLEHLLEPLETLKNMKAMLAPGGHAILSLPHVGHAVVMGCLWNSDFDLQEMGLLDKTHMRWFGVKNMYDLVREAGLRIVDVSFVIRDPMQTEFAQTWRLLPLEQQQAFLSGRYATVYQVVMKLSPAAGNVTGLNLMQQDVPGVRVTLAERLLPNYGIRGFIRRFLLSILSAEQRAKLKKLISK